MQKLTHVSLFSGIGGADLAAEWAGFETVLQCEIDPFCQKVLRKNFPGVPIIEDVRNVNITTYTDCQWQQQPQGSEQELRGRAIDRSQTNANQDTTSANGGSSHRDSFYKGRATRKGRRAGVSKTTEREDGITVTDDKPTNSYGQSPRLTLLTAGVPCQPASAAGKRRGKADSRWLWPEAIRVLRELQPAWAVFENPAGIGSLLEYGSPLEMDERRYSEKDIRDMGMSAYSSCERHGRGILDEIVEEIEKEGYEVQPVSISAASVGAPHKRQRIFIIAHSTSSGHDRLTGIDNGSKRGAFFSDTQERDTVRSQIKGCDQSTTHSLNERGNGSSSCNRGRNESQDCNRFSSYPNQLNGNNGGLSASEISQLETSQIPGLSINPDSQESGLEGSITEGNGSTGRLPAELGSYAGWKQNWIEVASRFCRVDDGLPRTLDRVARLKALGNAIVPAQIYPVLKAIADIELEKL